MTPQIALFIARLVLALALYSFLALVLWTLWSDVRQASTRLDRAPQAHLVVLDGPDVGRSLSLKQTSEVGRVAGNVVQLEDETVSARHARLSYQNGQWWLEDMASRNGTQLNEMQVEEPLVVAYGDEISFGRVLVKLEAGPVLAEPAAAPTLDQRKPA